ncbi:hypothetical protein GCM10023091_31140 [Ravibacter arvi]|uniref:T9SS type A sorting domain-containing protein n=1 Tax=Ravibacter arvi TaxID=2051041 RepID=A0ABP8M633_9BACT
MKNFTQTLFLVLMVLTASGQGILPGLPPRPAKKDTAPGAVQAIHPETPLPKITGYANRGNSDARTAASCSRINYPAPAGWGATNYYTGATVGSDGWINGMNVYQDKAKAMYFDLSSGTETHLTEVYVGFGRTYSADPEKTINVRVYDGTSNRPGAVLGEVPFKMKEIMQHHAAGLYTSAVFRSPVQLPASRKIFVGVDFSNLRWNNTVKDTLSIISNTAGQTNPSAIWELQSDNNWYQYTTAGSWNLSASLYVHPFLASPPPSIALASSATSVCEGMTLNFSAAGSTFESGILWSSGNGNLVASDDNLGTAVFRFDTPGSQWVRLSVAGGGCSTVLNDSVQITVNANTSTTGLAASSNNIQPGTEVTFTGSVAGGVVNPVFGFHLNGTEVQKTTSNEWKSSTLQNGDVVQVFVTSAGACVGPSQPITVQVQLPVKLVRLDVTEREAGTRITWEVAEEENVSHYDIEAGTGGRTFRKIGNVKASGKAERKTYAFNDGALYGLSPVYYRLRIEDFDGSFTYSPILVFYPRHQVNLVKVYPNPGKAGRPLRIAIARSAQPVARVTLYTQAGLLAGAYTVEKTGDSSFSLPAETPGGIYFISCYSSEGALLQTCRLVVD